ncbi:MAG: STAS domain-containing protein [Planctomycetota bacterium]|nr:STAS domain-containing protein [Planctomycetota bacterium]
MEIQEQRHGAVTVLKPQGALIHEDTEQFRDKVESARGKSFGRIVVDISSVPYVDSSGLEALVEITEQFSHSGNALKLCGVNETVREVLDLTDLTSLFEYFEDINAAVRSYL